MCSELKRRWMALSSATSPWSCCQLVMFVSGSDLTVIEGRKETSPMMLDIAEPHCVDRVEWCCLVYSTQSWPSWLLSSAWQNAWRIFLPLFWEFTRAHARACTQRLHETDKKNKQKSSPKQRPAYFNISIWYQYFFLFTDLTCSGAFCLTCRDKATKFHRLIILVKMSSYSKVWIILLNPQFMLIHILVI